MSFLRPDPLPALTAAERRRYGRHLVLPDVGEEGQRRLKAARVLIVGAGGLGSPAALYLAAAGVGRLGVVEFDAVEESDLQRQVAHGTGAIGRPKLESLRARLADLNPNVELVAHPVRLSAANALEILSGYDVVIDGSDNFATRYLVNDACVLLGKPDVHGSVSRSEGQLGVFHAPRGPCYRCVFPQPPPPGAVPSCAEAGVLGVLPGVIGVLQATEALKLVLGAGEPLVGRMLLYDAWGMAVRQVALRRDPDCRRCGARPDPAGLEDLKEACAAPAPAAEPGRLSVAELRALRERGEDFVLLDVREAQELALARLGGETHIPLGSLAVRAGELDRSRRIVVLCHHGVRSLAAARWLREQGFARVQDVRGGIEDWSRTVDPAVPRY